MCWGLPSVAQTNEIGLSAGVSYYVGDLNPIGHFRFPHPAGGIFYRRNFNWHWSIRAGFTYMKVSARDSLGTYDFQRYRNINFESHLFEAQFLCEFNFFPYKPGELKKYRWTPYLFLGVAGYYFAPQTEYNGELVALDALGTEGQFITGNSVGRYSRFQPAIPFGIGFKVNLSERFSLGFEYGFRILFTDYLDDVSTVYPDMGELLLVSGQAAVDLSDPSYSGGPPNSGFQRGFARTKDWYAFLGVSLVYNIRDKQECPGYSRKPKPWYRK